MKITDVRCVPVLVPRRRAYGGVVKTALGAAAFSDYTIVFVDTDAGITGLGEVDSVFKRRGALLRYLGSYPRMRGRSVPPPDFAGAARYVDAQQAVGALRLGTLRSEVHAQAAHRVVDRGTGARGGWGVP